MFALLRKLWLKLLAKPVDLDKAIKNDLKTAKGYYYLSAFFFIVALFVFVGFAIPVIQAVNGASLSAYEELVCVSGVALLLIIPLGAGGWHYLMGVVYEQSALRYRVVKLEQSLDALQKD